MFRHPLHSLAQAASSGMGALDVATRNFADTETDLFPAGQGWNGYGSQFQVGDGASPEEFHTVAGIRNIAPGTMETAVLDGTTLRSPNAHREKVAGMRDSGAFVLTGNWYPGHYTQNNAGDATVSSFATGGLISMWIDRQTRNWRIKCTDADTTTFPFRGFVSKFQPGDIGVDGVVPFTAEVTPVSDFSASLP